MGIRVDSLALRQQAITDSLTTDSITTDSLAILNKKEIEKLEAPVDTALLAKKNDSIQKALPTEKKRFIPNSNRATWLALIIPGGGFTIGNIGNCLSYTADLWDVPTR